MSILTAPVTYTEAEVRSYLPNGWHLQWNGGSWDPATSSWTTQISDGVDFDWRVAVSVVDAAKHGRIEALRLAIDLVFRERFTKNTRGLGIWRKG